MHGTDGDTEPRASALEELAADPSSRKRFLKAAGGAGAAGALAALVAACGQKKVVKPTPGGSNPFTGAGAGTDQYGRGDIGIARYALTIEYLEGDFYATVAKKGHLTGKAASLASEFGRHEKQHAKALENAVRKLGSHPPLHLHAQFPLDTPQKTLQFALSLESLGTADYLAQADKIQDKELLATVLSIHTVEGRHTAALATLLGQDPAPDGAFAKPAEAANVLNQLHRYTTGNT
jgi:rubrerythrin